MPALVAGIHVFMPEKIKKRQWQEQVRP